MGAQLLASLTHGFREIARAVAAAEARPSAVLTVSVAPVLAAKWLVPRLTRFYAAHPGLQLRTGRFRDLRRRRRRSRRGGALAQRTGGETGWTGTLPSL